MTPQIPVLGTFNVGRATAAGGTAFRALIPPFCGPAGSPRTLFSATGRKNFGGGITKVGTVCYTTGGTAHQIGLMRPFNYTYVASAAAINQAVINITADPGVYSTNYQYGSPLSTGTGAVADNAIAASDICVYQLSDGTWILDTVSSVSTLAITMATSIPNITGGGVLAGSLFYFFGVIGDKDPATGLVNPQNTIAASQVRDKSWHDPIAGVVSALHEGDPLVFYSPNGTNAGELEFISGYYAKI